MLSNITHTCPAEVTVLPCGQACFDERPARGLEGQPHTCTQCVLRIRVPCMHQLGRGSGSAHLSCSASWRAACASLADSAASARSRSSARRAASASVMACASATPWSNLQRAATALPCFRSQSGTSNIKVAHRHWQCKWPSTLCALYVRPFVQPAPAEHHPCLFVSLASAASSSRIRRLPSSCAMRTSASSLQAAGGGPQHALRA